MTPVQDADVRVDSIAAGGDGVARLPTGDGGSLVVFVPRSAPGDEGRARIVTKGRFARGELLSIAVPSSDRTEPPCEHYTRDRCGGCQIQHLRYDAQLEAKRGIVADAITRIGKRDVERPTVESSPRQWRYRRKLTLALRRRGDRWIAGLHPYDSPRGVFELRDCPITDERVVAAWRTVMSLQRLLPDARELRGAVRLLEAGFSFVLEGGDSWPRSKEFFEGFAGAEAIWWAPENGRRRLLHDRRSVAAPGASFAQVNREVSAALWSYVEDRVSELRPATLVDAYSGAGDSAARIAARGVAVTAIEADAEAARWCAERLPAGSRSIAGRVEDALPGALPADVVILNPPRTGLHEQVPSVLQSSGPRHVLYVSCSPPTLARDLARMPDYRIERLRAFDMFPQTAHVETVCELTREAA